MTNKTKAQLLEDLEKQEQIIQTNIETLEKKDGAIRQLTEARDALQKLLDDQAELLDGMTSGSTESPVVIFSDLWDQVEDPETGEVSLMKLSITGRFPASAQQIAGTVLNFREARDVLIKSHGVLPNRVDLGKSNRLERQIESLVETIRQKDIEINDLHSKIDAVVNQVEMGHPASQDPVYENVEPDFSDKRTPAVSQPYPPRQPQQPAPSQGSPQGNGGGGGYSEWFFVESVFPDFIANNKDPQGSPIPFLQVKTTAKRFNQYGVRAYWDSCNVPDAVKEVVESGKWPVKKVKRPGEHPVLNHIKKCLVVQVGTKFRIEDFSAE